jgi:hypothetical protein
MPDIRTIIDMWDDNPHGAGIMWRSGSLVKYAKGFMKQDKFLKFLKKNEKELAETEVAMHFRIATHGGINPWNTHPFPMDPGTNTKSMSGTVRSCMMHNGVLPIVPRNENISDTAELSLRAKAFPSPEKYIESIAEYVSADNRILVFAPDSTLFVGDWHEENGLSFSNLNFKSMYDLGMGYQPMYYYDWNDMSWKNSKGRKVRIEDVDPYMLSYEDEDAYYAQKNGKWDEWCANEYGFNVAAM